MRRTILLAMTISAAVSAASAGPAPRPGDARQLGAILKQAQKMRGLIITDADEIRLGEAVSQKVRARYGVVQDLAVHRYVTLVGTALAMTSSRPNLPWTFVVLDTDGVNAFAAPGGIIHITRGALGLLNDEAELAGALAHEITHVTQKHTVKAIQEGKIVEFGADAVPSLSDNAVFNKVVDTTTEAVLAGFGRKEELESDREGVRLANKVGYDPRGLERFLRRLSERNTAATEKQGLFASHPEMKERLDLLARQVTAEKLASTATLEPRYHKFITYKAKAQTEIAAVEAGAAGLTGGGKSDKQEEKKDEQPKKKGFGLGSLLKPTATESKSAEVTGSGASRGVDTERNAKGGPNPALVVVKVNAGDISDFKREGNLK